MTSARRNPDREREDCNLIEREHDGREHEQRSTSYFEPVGRDETLLKVASHRAQRDFILWTFRATAIRRNGAHVKLVHVAVDDLLC